MKDGGVIEEITEATEWVSPMVPVVKPSGEIRICVDLKKLKTDFDQLLSVQEHLWKLNGGMHKLKKSVWQQCELVSDLNFTW